MAGILADAMNLKIHVIKSSESFAEITINEGTSFMQHTRSIYSRTSLYGHLSDTDTSIVRTVSFVPTKSLHVFLKNTLYNTDPFQYGQRTLN